MSARPVLRALPSSSENRDYNSDAEMIESTTAAAGLFSAKWKVDLLFLLAAGVRRHARLHDHLLVSKKVLTEALKSLERDGLVQRHVFPETPVRVEYTLTPLGRSLTGPLFALWEWADERLELVLAARREFDLRRGRRSQEINKLPRFSAHFQIRKEIARDAGVVHPPS